jgi:hypothetical protein
MAGDPFRKVNPGEDVEFSATAWNAMLESVQPNRDMGRAASFEGSPVEHTIVRVKNESGVALARNTVLGLDDPVFTPTDSLDTFLGRIAFRATKPLVGAHDRRYCVLLDPAGIGQFARGYVAGVCAVKVDLVDESHGFARIINNDTAKLQSGRYGHAQILWTESQGAYYGYSTGVQWAIVRLGVTMSSFAVGKAKGAISPRSGTTFGYGQVDLYRYNAATADGPIETIDVVNASAETMTYGDGIDDGIWVSVAWDAEGVAWVAPLECAGAYA